MPEGRGHRASKPQSLNKKKTISYDYLCPREGDIFSFIFEIDNFASFIGKINKFE
jgi:hypothetical protein